MEGVPQRDCTTAVRLFLMRAKYVMKTPRCQRICVCFLIALCLVTVAVCAGGSRMSVADYAAQNLPPGLDPVRALAEMPRADEIGDAELAAPVYEPGRRLARAMMAAAWEAYARLALPGGWDELRPLSGTGTNMGTRPLMLTAIDALDTMHIMGLDEQYAQARDAAVHRFVPGMPGSASFFETNIRVLGGLLGAYALTGDEGIRDQAVALARIHLANIDPATGMPPYDMAFDVPLRKPFDAPVRPDKAYELAVIGTLVVEFAYVSRITGDPAFEDAALRINRWLRVQPTDLRGLLPATVNASDGLSSAIYTLGAHADSYYEYLLKYWLLRGMPSTGEPALHRDAYKAALVAFRRELVVERDGHSFIVARRKDGAGQLQAEERAEALACFAPGMIALGAWRMNDRDALALAERLAETCYMSNAAQATGLAPEMVAANKSFEPSPGQTHWIQRPESIESMFYLWRITGRVRYRRWGIAIGQAIEREARAGATGGYAELRDVRVRNDLMDHQQSFLLAEVLKYLFLLCSAPDVLPLDRFVLNTEAHPFPVEGL